MNPELKKEWIEALRGGTYRQGGGSLRKQGFDGTSFCCLGVLCEMSDEIEWNGTRYIHAGVDFTTSLSASLNHEYGLDIEVGLNNVVLFDHLINMNDIQKKNFDEIADYLEGIEF